MRIQVNTDNHVHGDAALESRLNAMIEQHIGRFSPHLTRIEVQLSDANADKGGGQDKECAIEARLEEERPVGVSHHDEDMEKAIRGACNKLEARLETLVEQHHGH